MLKEPLKEDEVTGKIIGAAIEVHKQLGPGLLESAYQIVGWEMELRGIQFAREKPANIYKGINVALCYRLDFLVEDLIVVELKSGERI